MTEQAFADRVKAVLANTGITQFRLAELAGVSQPTISEIVRGAQPRLGTYLKVEKALVQLEQTDANG